MTLADRNCWYQTNEITVPLWCLPTSSKSLMWHSFCQPDNSTRFVSYVFPRLLKIFSYCCIYLPSDKSPIPFLLIFFPTCWYPSYLGDSPCIVLLKNISSVTLGRKYVGELYSYWGSYGWVLSHNIWVHNCCVIAFTASALMQWLVFTYIHSVSDLVLFLHVIWAFIQSMQILPVIKALRSH